MTPSEADGHVRRHLRDNGFPGNPNGLEIQTEPGSAHRFVTTVRNSHRDDVWPAWYASRLANALDLLPCADVRLRPVVDKIVVVWGPS